MNTGAMELNIKKMGPVDRSGFNPVVCAVGAVLGAAKGALAGGAIGLAGSPEGTAAGAVVGALIGGAVEGYILGFMCSKDRRLLTPEQAPVCVPAYSGHKAALIR